MGQIAAHRNILSVRCEYFSTMLASAFREGQPGGQVEVRDTTPGAFKSLLNFLYTDELVFDDEDVLQLMRLAHRYDIMKVYARCKTYCRRKIDVNNCIDWLLRANEHGIAELRDIF